MMKYTSYWCICMLLLCIGSQQLLAQDTGALGRAATKRFNAAEDAMHRGNYQEAEPYYLDVLDRVPDFVIAKVRLGALYFETGQQDLSKHYFIDVLDTLPEAYPLIYFRLGEIYWKQEQYDSVIYHMDRFLALADPRTSNLRAAKKYQRDAEFIRSGGKALSHDLEITELPPVINTQAPEYLPTMPASSDFLVFTRRVQGQEDFFISKRQDGKWSPAQPLVDLNTYENEGAHCLSADGKILIFTACSRRDGLGSCDLYFSVRTDKGWTKPRNMGSGINTSAWEGQPSLSASGTTMYFSSDRPGGMGGRDIWRADRTSNGWAAPVPVSDINTPDDEEAPFIHPDNASLYFMSDGYPGYGGSDLFLTRMENDRWSLPVNLGAPLNTPENEGALFIDLTGKTGYFARSGFEPEGNGQDIDIYSFPVPESIRPKPATYARIFVTNAQDGTPVRGIVELYDLERSAYFLRTPTDENGNLLVCLTTGHDYAIKVGARNFAFFSSNVNLVQTTDVLEPHRIDARLQPLLASYTKADTSEAIVLENVFFASGSADLLHKSLHELDDLKTLMDQHPDMKVEILGHTDNVGSDADNLSLSIERAKAVYLYLQEQGIAPERLGYRGFGEEKPIADNETEAGRQQNRRTEFRMIN